MCSGDLLCITSLEHLSDAIQSNIPVKFSSRKYNSIFVKVCRSIVKEDLKCLITVDKPIVFTEHTKVDKTTGTPVNA